MNNLLVASHAPPFHSHSVSNVMAADTNLNSTEARTIGVNGRYPIA